MVADNISTWEELAEAASEIIGDTEWVLRKLEDARIRTEVPDYYKVKDWLRDYRRAYAARKVQP